MISFKQYLITRTFIVFSFWIMTVDSNGENDTRIYDSIELKEVSLVIKCQGILNSAGFYSKNTSKIDATQYEANLRNDLEKVKNELSDNEKLVYNPDHTLDIGKKFAFKFVLYLHGVVPKEDQDVDFCWERIKGFKYISFLKNMLTIK